MSPRPFTRRLVLGLFVVAVAAGLPSPAGSQSLWMPRDVHHAVMLEMLRPRIEGVDPDFFSAPFFLSGRLALANGITIVGELPYVRHKSTQTFTDFLGNEVVVESSSSTIGDPYIGMEARPGASPIFVEVGVRPPLASENEGDAVLTGYISDVVRQDAFLPKVLSIHTAFNLREVTPARVAYRLRFSPVLAVPTEGGSPELFTVYSFLIGYEGPYARVGGGMSGRALVSEDFGNLGSRTLNQVELHADFLQGAIRPGLDLRLPLGEVSDLVPVALGASLAWVR